MAKFKFHVSTGYVGSKREDVIEIPDDELNGTEFEKNKVIQKYFEEWVWESIDASWTEE